MSAVVVLVQTAPHLAVRRYEFRGRVADILEEVVEVAEQLGRLHTGRLVFDISQGNVSMEFCIRRAPRKRTAPLVGAGPLTIEEAAAALLAAAG